MNKLMPTLIALILILSVSSPVSAETLMDEIKWTLTGACTGIRPELVTTDPFNRFRHALPSIDEEVEDIQAHGGIFFTMKDGTVLHGLQELADYSPTPTATVPATVPATAPAPAPATVVAPAVKSAPTTSAISAKVTDDDLSFEDVVIAVVEKQIDLTDKMFSEISQKTGKAWNTFVAQAQVPGLTTAQYRAIIGTFAAAFKEGFKTPVLDFLEGCVDQWVRINVACFRYWKGESK